jgi:two-component system, NarL family, sensor kinase
MASPTIELAPPVPRPRPVVVAGSLAAVGVSLIVVSVLLYLSEGLPRLRVSFAQTPAAVLPQQATAAGYILVGALLGSRLPRNPVGWLLLAAGLVWATLLPLSMLVTAAHEALRPVPPVTLALAWLSSSFATPVLAMLMGLAALLFPDGRLVGPRWWPVALLLVLAPLLLGLTAAVGPSSLVWYWTLPNPLAVPRTLSPAVFGVQVAAIALLVLGFAGLVASLVVRYRRGDAVTRAQLRWIVFAIAVQAICAVPFVLARYVVPVSATAGELTVAASVAASLLLPIAGAVAITRHHLFGIDRVINRTLVYVPLLGLLAGLYAAAAALFQRLFTTLTGETSEVPLLMAVFIIAAAFTPVRKWLEGVVDRWAHAPSLDAASAAAASATGPATVPAASLTGGVASAEAGAVASGAAGRVPSPGAAGTPAPAAVGVAPVGAAAPVDDPELLRVAAALLALRRFEERLAAAPAAAADAVAAPTEGGAATPDAGPAVGRRLPIRDGSVDCPMGGRVTPATCLGCAYLLAIGTTPPEVTCGHPSWAAAQSAGAA